jgi:hypothetical protein
VLLIVGSLRGTYGCTSNGRNRATTQSGGRGYPSMAAGTQGCCGRVRFDPLDILMESRGEVGWRPEVEAPSDDDALDVATAFEIEEIGSGRLVHDAVAYLVPIGPLGTRTTLPTSRRAKRTRLLEPTFATAPSEREADALAAALSRDSPRS